MSTEPIVHGPHGTSFARFLNPLAMVSNLWSHRQLTWQLARREIVARYRGSYLGLLWSILTPLLLLAVYTFAFSVVFRARWSDDPSESHADFALTMFCGLLLFNLFAEVVNRAPGMVTGNASYVKRVVFPLEILVITALISALINMLIGYGVWLAGWVVLRAAPPHATIVFFPVILLPVCLMTAGLAWVLASLGVFIRDVGHAVIVVVQVLFFATPIFYSIERVPYPFRQVLELNPLTHTIEDVRRVLIAGTPPSALGLGFALVASALLALLGYAFFMKSRRAFADVV